MVLSVELKIVPNTGVFELMKILVTGGAGFIGSHLVDRLLEKRQSVVCVDNLLLGRRDFLTNAMKNKNFTFYNFDLLDIDKLDKLFKEQQFDFIYHLAANSDIRAGVADTSTDLNLTFKLTYNILECMRVNKVNKILFTSSPTVFGDTDKPLTEDLPMKPESLYGASKLASEAYIRAFSSLYGFQSWMLRLSNMVGGRATHGILYDFVYKVQNNPNELIVLGDGKQCKPYMYVQELIDCIFFVVENATDQVNTFNVGPKDGARVSEIAKLFLKYFGKDHKIKYTGGKTGWKGDVPFYSHNSEKLNNLGWAPKLSSIEAVEKAVLAMRSKSK